MSTEHPERGAGRVAASLVPRLAPFGLFAVAVVVLLGPSLTGARVALPHDIHLEHLPWRVSEAAEPARNPELRDTVDQYYPMQAELIGRVREGRDATWIRDAGLGQLGIEFVGWGALSIFNAPALVLPFDLAWSWAQALRLYAAMVGTYLLVRGLGAGRSGATVAGLSFGLSGFMVAWLGWPQSHVGAVIPWVLWAVRIVTVRIEPPWWGLPALALGVAALWLGGFPAVSVYGLIAAGIVALHGLVSVRHLGRVVVTGRAAAVAGGIVLGTLLVAFTLLPSSAWLDVMDLGARERAFRARIFPAYLWTFLFPGVFGDVVNHPRWLRSAYVETIGYAGVVTAALIVAAWVLRPLRAARRAIPDAPEGLGLFTGLGVGFGLLAYGFPPLVALIERVPPLSTNAPSRTIVLVGLAIAVCGGLGVDAVQRWVAGRTRIDRRAVLVVAVAAAALAAYALSGPIGELRATAAERLQPEELRDARHVAVASVRRAAVLVAAGVAVVVVALRLARRERAGRHAEHTRGAARGQAAAAGVGFALCALVAIDLLDFATGWNTQVPRDGLFPNAPAIAELVDLGPTHRTAGADGAGHASVNLVYGLADLRARAFLTARQRAVLRDMEVRFLSPTRWDLATVSVEEWEPWLSASAVAAVIAPADVGQPPSGWHAEHHGPVEVWRNPDARERVVAVPRAERLDAEDVVAAREALDRAALHDVALVETATPVPLPDGRRADIVEWDADGSRVHARVRSDGGAVVVVAEAAVPGWQATVDGEPASVVTADYLFLGVAVPSGERVVELRYRAPGALPGRLLSGFSLLLLVVAAAAAWRGGRRAPDHRGA